MEDSNTQTQESTNIISRLVQIFMKQVDRHGAVFLVLALIAYVQNNQNQKLAAEVKDCNNAMIEVYRSDRLEMQKSLDRNTMAWEQLRQAMKIYN